MPFNLGLWEILLVLFVLLLVFGAKRLPEIGSGMAKGIKEFKKGISEMKSNLEEGEDEPDRKRLDAPEKESGDPKKLSE
jgi:sec-independent protein translocase protein TatA